MRKFTFSFKTLLLLASMLIGGGNYAWADLTIYTYDFATAASGGDISWEREASDVTVTGMNDNTLYMPRNCSYDFGERFAIGRLYQSSGNYNNPYLRKNSGGLLFQNPKNGGYLAILNLAVGDKITINATTPASHDGTNYKYQFKNSILEGVADDAEITFGTEYTVKTAGYQLIYIKTPNNKNFTFTSIVVKSTTDAISRPSASLTSVNTSTGVRTIAVTNGTSTLGESVKTYYSTSTRLSSANYSTSGTEVSAGSVDVDEYASTLYMVSVNTSGRCSQDANFNIAAATKFSKTGSVSLTSVSNRNTYLYNPIFTITAPDGATVFETSFTPASTGIESSRTAFTSGNTYVPTENGTLTVYASARGYSEASSYSIPVSDYYTVSYSHDYTTYTQTPFGQSLDVSSDWWTGAKAYRSTASSNTTLGRLRFGNNTVTDLVIGYGVGRYDKNCSLKIRYATKGNIEVLTMNNNNSSGVTSGTYFNNILETSGSGEETELTSEFYATKLHTVKIHKCYSPANNPGVTDWSNEIIGAFDKSTASADDVFGSGIVLKKGEIKKITFKNHGSDYGKNWMLKYTYGGSEVTTIRADWYWKYEGDGNASKRLGSYTDAYASENGLNWSTWTSDMDNSTVVLTVSNINGKFAVDGTMTGSSDTYYLKYAYDNSFNGDITLNLSVNLSWIEVLSVEQTQTTSSANLQGYKTFYDADFNYQVDESTTIYKASAYTAGKSVTLTPVAGKIVPKNTPVVLKTTDAGYNITLTPTASDSEDDFTGNLLGVYDGTSWSKDAGDFDVVYMLGYTESEKFGLYLYTATPDEGDIAVLVPSGGTAKKVSLVVDGEATEVVAPEVAEVDEEEVLFNMAGIQVDKNFKGIVINQKGVKRFNR